MATPPPLPTPPRPPVRPPDWWKRNWPWFVPVVAVSFLMLVVGLIVAVMTLMKSSGAYTEGVARAKAAPAVIAALGEPITEGLFATGQVSLKNDTGRANLQVSLRGPKASASLFIVASKQQGSWQFQRLLVELDGGRGTIDLTKTSLPSSAPVEAPRLRP